ncbi:hypothetical protein BRC94_11555 [Halobacteriales archaeon QS_5_70_17]|nr:MAG: hypothetical protein BRC94_11555 [Halobacteriales archaeon QS_5_70_17]
MSESLVVDVNQDGLHTLAVPGSFRASGSFDVRLQNHGEATHVYLHLDDALSSIASIPESHHYVDKDDIQVVRVAVEDGATGSGTLEVTTAHGATTEGVPVEVGADAPEKPPVEVDESLAEPAPQESEPVPALGGAGGAGPDVVPAVALGGVAILLAVATFTVSGTAAIVLAVLAVVTALAAAAYVAVNRRRERGRP